MSGKKLVLVGLAIVVALGSIFAVACGGDDTAAKDAMKAALTKINADMDALTAQMMSGGTAADVKAAKVALEPDWQAVIDAAEDVEGADPAKAQQVWDDVAAAIDSVPESADLTTLAGAVMGPVTALQAYVAELAELVGLDTTAATGAE